MKRKLKRRVNIERELEAEISSRTLETFGRVSMLIKAKLRLPRDFRFITRKDCRYTFRSGDKRMDRFTLQDYFDWHQKPDSIVIVKDFGGRPGALMHLRIFRGYVLLDMLARDKDVPRGLGAELVTLVEEYIAPSLRSHEIRLDAMKHVVRWYDERLGYEEYAEPYDDPDWGQLTPKRKLLP